MSWKELLSLILSAGPKLKLVWPLVLQAFEHLKAVAELVNKARELLGVGTVVPSPDGTLSVVAATDEEAALEAQVVCLISPEGAEAAWDGSRLRSIWKFLQDTGLDMVLLQILKGLLSGATA